MALSRLASLTSFTILFLFTSLQAQASNLNLGSGGGGKEREKRSRQESSYVPVRSVVYRSMALPSAAARATKTETEAVGYEPFEVCKGCRCCSASNTSSCVDTSCCYSIDCNLPGKPFGTCAFKPRTCGCGDTSNCTQPS